MDDEDAKPQAHRRTQLHPFDARLLSASLPLADIDGLQAFAGYLLDPPDADLYADPRTVLSLLLGVPAGYALARSTSRYAVAVAYFFMAIRMVPAVAALIPFYLMMRDIGLLGSWVAVVLINAMLNSAFVTWMMFSYFRGLPKELEEAALTDGCTLFGAFWKVALPAVRSGIVASILFCLMFSWNDFLYPMFLTKLDSKPISVALLSAYGTKDITWGTLGALSHFSTIPIVLIVLVLNRYFVQGLTKGIH
jgi:multiple sugar transport system permease protein